MLKENLASEVYQIREVADGNEVLPFLHRHKADLIVLDMKMAGMDGLATLAALAQAGYSQPVIAFTAFSSVESAVGAMKKGAFDYIAKPDATESQVIAAAQAAEADEFIRDVPLGYQTLLGEGGAGLSGGQKRLLDIARAFLRNVPIVLLDEPTVGLDAASEQKVIAAVQRLTKGKTTLIVTHQLATITDTDLIVVLVGGKIVESGNYQELMNKNGVFSELWERQMGDVLK